LVVSDRPHEAILATATARGCDLIFMASRGGSGLARMLRGSVTQKVLQEATLPVLVTAVASNLPRSEEQCALSIIRNEHRSLAAVIHGLEHVVRESIRLERTPDFVLLGSMLIYIEVFPERLHHPKEDAHLFARLRARTDECDAVIGELERQHVEGAGDFAELRHALAAWEAGAVGAAERFASAVERFAQGQWRHMGAEEALVLPAASRHLTPDDWAAIARAFGDNGDPRFDADTDASFERLFSRLMNLAATQPLA
jgi:hemerythrin-like domain-containing protein